MFALVIVVAATSDGALSWDQPGLAVAVACALAVALLGAGAVAVSAWRLAIGVDGTELWVRGLRRRHVDLARVVSVRSGGWRWWFDPWLQLRSTAPGPGATVTIPLRSVLGMASFDVFADLGPVVRALYDGLGNDVVFDGASAWLFRRYGCPLHEAGG